MIRQVVKMVIRKAQPADLDDWVVLRKALWPEGPLVNLRSEAENILQSSDEVCFLLVDDLKHTVGFIECAIHTGQTAPYGHVEGWYVDPRFRKQGHGKDLVEQVAQWCLHRSIVLLTSDTDAHYPVSPVAHLHSGFKLLAELKAFIKELK